MGMYDTVLVKCPKCIRIVEFQSKAGECCLSEYNIESVPPEIAKDLTGDIENCECGYKIKLRTKKPVTSVEMVCCNEEDS